MYFHNKGIIIRFVNLWQYLRRKKCIYRQDTPWYYEKHNFQTSFFKKWFEKLHFSLWYVCKTCLFSDLSAMYNIIVNFLKQEWQNDLHSSLRNFCNLPDLVKLIRLLSFFFLLYDHWLQFGLHFIFGCTVWSPAKSLDVGRSKVAVYKDQTYK